MENIYKSERNFQKIVGSFTVAPYAGAWIEIVCTAGSGKLEQIVAPYAGAWIEMTKNVC